MRKGTIAEHARLHPLPANVATLPANNETRPATKLRGNNRRAPLQVNERRTKDAVGHKEQRAAARAKQMDETEADRAAGELNEAAASAAGDAASANSGCPDETDLAEAVKCDSPGRLCQPSVNISHSGYNQRRVLICTVASSPPAAALTQTPVPPGYLTLACRQHWLQEVPVIDSKLNLQSGVGQWS